MKRIIGLVLAAAALTLAPLGALADTRAAGEKEYMSNCAVCHGMDGTGGPYMDFLKAKPADLTTLTRNNNGAFPFGYVYEVIDGRASVKAHGPREMPIWGIEYTEAAARYYEDYFKAYDTESFVRGRIFALIEYLDSIQK